MIAEVPPEAELPAQWLVLRVDHADEIQHAVQLLERSPLLHGIYLFPAGDLPLWRTFKDGYDFVKAAGGVVMDEHGRLLAIRRLGRWDLPKGKVEKGEDTEAAALREVQEECGIQQLELVAPLTRTWHTYLRNGKHHLKRTDWYHMRSSSAEVLVPQAEEDIQEVKWVDRNEAVLVKADTYASLLPVFEAWESLAEQR